MKKFISTLLGIFAAIALCCICSEPGSRSFGSWLIWELSWIAALAIDAKLWVKLNPESDGE